MMKPRVRLFGPFIFESFPLVGSVSFGGGIWIDALGIRLELELFRVALAIQYMR